MSKIVVYTTDWCAACNATKRFLESKNLDYEEINIETNRISRSMLMELTGRLVVPTVVVDGKVIGGRDKLQQIL